MVQRMKTLSLQQALLGDPNTCTHLGEFQPSKVMQILLGELGSLGLENNRQGGESQIVRKDMTGCRSFMSGETKLRIVSSVRVPPTSAAMTSATSLVASNRHAGQGTARETLPRRQSLRTSDVPSALRRCLHRPFQRRAICPILGFNGKPLLKPRSGVKVVNHFGRCRVPLAQYPRNPRRIGRDALSQR